MGFTARYQGLSPHPHIPMDCQLFGWVKVLQLRKPSSVQRSIPTSKAAWNRCVIWEMYGDVTWSDEFSQDISAQQITIGTCTCRNCSVSKVGVPYTLTQSHRHASMDSWYVFHWFLCLSLHVWFPRLVSGYKRKKESFLDCNRCMVESWTPNVDFEFYLHGLSWFYEFCIRSFKGPFYAYCACGFAFLVIQKNCPPNNWAESESVIVCRHWGTKVKLQQTGRNLRQDLGLTMTRSCFQKWDHQGWEKSSSDVWSSMARCYRFAKRGVQLWPHWHIDHWSLVLEGEEQPQTNWSWTVWILVQWFTRNSPWFS